MMTLDQISTATIDQLTDELAAAGWDATQTELHSAREAVARLLCEVNGSYDLRDESNELIREATTDETVESVLAGPEGWIEADGQKCYVCGLDSHHPAQ
jgi:hypothetical protein